MKKFIVRYTKHEPYVDEETGLTLEDLRKNLICVYADTEGEACNMVLNNIKYSYTYYNTIDKVMEVTEENINKFNAVVKIFIDDPVNKDMSKNWELDKRDTFF